MKKINFFATIKKGKIIFQDEKSFMKYCLEMEGEELEIIIRKKISRRTASQNNAMHLYFEMVSNSLNESGLNIEKVIQGFTIEHDWTPALVKELLWREAQKFVTKKESTTELNKQEEIDKVWEIMNRFLAKLKVESIPFPCMDQLMGENQ